MQARTHLLWFQVPQFQVQGSRLNHPHIAAIYGLEDTGGVRALVLELVDGETLADRIRRGPLPLRDALTIARQIADALEAAHEKGIVHRDLKPANIKVTPDGVVKVLDFGLAKVADDASAPDLSNSPTVTFGGTREGTILGTAAYMSPEQARGQVVDKRTDIWAFGCVLFETQRAPSTRDWRPTYVAGAFIVIAVLLAAGGALLFRVMPSTPVTSPSEYTQLTNFANAAVAPSLSPDGRMVTSMRGGQSFFSRGQIYVKLLPNGESVRLTNDEGGKYGPVFTPDGSRIAYTNVTGTLTGTPGPFRCSGGHRRGSCPTRPASRGSAISACCSPRSKVAASTWAS